MALSRLTTIGKLELTEPFLVTNMRLLQPKCVRYIFVYSIYVFSVKYLIRRG